MYVLAILFCQICTPSIQYVEPTDEVRYKLEENRQILFSVNC